MSNFIYADNAATTKISDSVFNAMLPYLKDEYGNPSSIYEFGGRSKKAIEDARETVANCIGALPSEIYFTSGGSESDNWAIKGAAYYQAQKGKKHIISSIFEHHAVLHALDSLKRDGFEITLLPVYENGIVRVEDVEHAIRPDTALVTIMYANNEIGTIQPIAEIGRLCRDRGVIFHTDAVQALGNVKIDVVAENIDLLSISGHKIHAPKGIGALYCRKGVHIRNVIDGGAQERGKRAGTENVAFIAGLSVAIKEAVENIEEKAKKLAPLRDRLIDFGLTMERTRLNGDRNKRLPCNVNLSFEGIEGESLLLMLDLNGICASSGSACTSGSLDPSHVLLSIGLSHEVAHGSLRISLSDYNTSEEVDRIIEVLPGVVKRLRDMSPLWERIVKNNTK